METKETIVDGQVIQPVTGLQDPAPGTVGLQDQVPGQPTTVGTAAQNTDGIDAGNFIEPDIDSQLFNFQSDDTPLMQLMLKAKNVSVDSPEVDHYMVDEPKPSVTTTGDIAESSAGQAVLPLESAEARIPRPFYTLSCKGVDGYDPTGQEVTVGVNLMLFVVGIDPTTQCPIVTCVNGPKAQSTDEVCTMPAIPAGTEVVILGNACHETQKNVDPDMVVPKPRRVYLQKFIMNQIVSDYFDSQRKRIPFQAATIAERMIANFKIRCNRTLWIGKKGKVNIDVPMMGTQTVYFTEGIRWQFLRQLDHTGAWEYDHFIALAKMFYTGEDVPKGAICLCGKNFLENIQKIDWSKHPEVRIEVKTNNLGWEITNIHTVFGDLQFKREPCLDRIGFENSAAIIGNDRLVHYTRTSEHSFNEKVEGHEATRSGIIRWDGLALKGGCHIWVNGESGSASSTSPTGGVTYLEMVDCTDISEIQSDLVDGYVYYFLNQCKISDTLTAAAGDMYLYSKGTWTKYTGSITVE